MVAAELRFPSAILKVVMLFALAGCAGAPNNSPTQTATSTHQITLTLEAPTPTLALINTPTSTPLPDLATQLIVKNAGNITYYGPYVENIEVSGNGHYIVYEEYTGTESSTDSLTYFFNQIYLYNMQTGTTTLVSAASDGTAGNDYSVVPSISEDGSTIAFFSFATNIDEAAQKDCQVVSPEAHCGSLYIYDTATGGFSRVTVGAAWPGTGQMDTALSEDGRFVAFASRWAAIKEGVFLYDSETGDLTTITAGDTSDPNNPGSAFVDISGDGRVVAFASDEDNLVAGDNNGTFDVFVYDHDSGKITRASTPVYGIETSAGSGAGLVLGTQVSIYGNVSLSADGRYVVYGSGARLTSQRIPGGGVYLYDRETGQNELISLTNEDEPADYGAGNATMSADGRYIVFESASTNLAPGCLRNDTICIPQVYLRDRILGRTILISQGLNGEPGDDTSLEPVISADGRYMVYVSKANNLTPDGNMGAWNLFITDLRLLGVGP